MAALSPLNSYLIQITVTNTLLVAIGACCWNEEIIFALWLFRCTHLQFHYNTTFSVNLLSWSAHRVYSHVLDESPVFDRPYRTAVTRTITMWKRSRHFRQGVITILSDLSRWLRIIYEFYSWWQYTGPPFCPALLWSQLVFKEGIRSHHGCSNQVQG